MYVIMYAATMSQRTTRRTRVGDSVVAELLSRVFEGAAAFRSAIKFPRASSGPRFSKAVRWSSPRTGSAISQCERTPPVSREGTGVVSHFLGKHKYGFY